jgi:hypothetical protein
MFAVFPNTASLLQRGPYGQETRQDILRELEAVEDQILGASVVRDAEAYWELIEERVYLLEMLKHARPAAVAKPVPKPLCTHTRCGLPRTTIDCPDDHDSNAGMYYVRDYCSLNCFVCDLKHAWDEKNGDRFREILRRIGA